MEKLSALHLDISSPKSFVSQMNNDILIGINIFGMSSEYEPLFLAHLIIKTSETAWGAFCTVNVVSGISHSVLLMICDRM